MSCVLLVFNTKQYEPIWKIKLVRMRGLSGTPSAGRVATAGWSPPPRIQARIKGKIGRDEGFIGHAQCGARSYGRLVFDTKQYRPIWEIKLVGMRGFEPPTTCTPYRCATRLRYIPTQAQMNI